MKPDKNQLKREYKQRPLKIGVFLIRNTINDKVFLASGKDLSGIMNSHKFQLQNGIHANKSLQEEWQRVGADNFALEILEELNLPGDAQFDAKQELELMENMWLDKLKPFGDRGYNQPKLNRAEQLRRIAAKGSRRETS